MNLEHMGVTIGAGSFFGATASLGAPLISTTPEFLHWFPLALAVAGMVIGFWVSHQLRK